MTKNLPKLYEMFFRRASSIMDKKPEDVKVETEDLKKLRSYIVEVEKVKSQVATLKESVADMDMLK